MYIDSVPNRSSPPAVLLRESYRDGGQVKKRTLANLSKLPTDAIQVLRRVLRGERLVKPEDAFTCVRSLPHGHIAAVLGTLKQLGLHTLIARNASRVRDLALARLSLNSHLDCRCRALDQLALIVFAAEDILVGPSVPVSDGFPPRGARNQFRDRQLVQDCHRPPRNSCATRCVTTIRQVRCRAGISLRIPANSGQSFHRKPSTSRGALYQGRTSRAEQTIAR